MKQYARIENQTVVELLSTDGDINKMFHPSIAWVDCTAINGVAVGWDYIAGVFSAKAQSQPTVAEIRASMQCTAYQIRQALSAMGLRDAAENAIAISGNQELKDAWQFATNFRRDNPKIAAIAAALNKTDADIDALFDLAITLSP